MLWLIRITSPTTFAALLCSSPQSSYGYERVMICNHFVINSVSNRCVPATSGGNRCNSIRRRWPVWWQIALNFDLFHLNAIFNRNYLVIIIRLCLMHYYTTANRTKGQLEIYWRTNLIICDLPSCIIMSLFATDSSLRGWDVVWRVALIHRHNTIPTHYFNTGYQLYIPCI